MIPIRYNPSKALSSDLHHYYAAKVYEYLSKSVHDGGEETYFDMVRASFSHSYGNIADICHSLDQYGDEIRQTLALLPDWIPELAGDAEEAAWRRYFIAMFILGRFEVLRMLVQKLSLEKVDPALKQYAECYKSVIRKKIARKKLSAYIVEGFGIRACPYCNRSYIDTLKDSTTAEMDHFYPKDKYPLLALSLYNLVPCCASCNRHKGDELLNYSPHDQSVSEDMFRFAYRFKRGAWYNWHSLTNARGEDAIGVCIEYDSAGNSEEQAAIESDIRLLGINDIYERCNDRVWEILCRQTLYTEDYIQDICRRLRQSGISQSTVNRILYGNYIDAMHLHMRPLSKLTRDILKYLNIDCDGESPTGAETGNGD